jgi:hypothetical protein
MIQNTVVVTASKECDTRSVRQRAILPPESRLKGDRTNCPGVENDFKI